MKTEKQIFDSRQPAVMTDTGSARVFLFMNEQEVKTHEPSGEGDETIEVTKYEYDVATVTPASKSDQDILEAVRQEVLREIDAYDTSSAVNEFTYQGEPMWYDKVTRTCITYSMQTEKAAGAETTTLYDNLDRPHTLPVDTAIALFGELELYAKQCSNVTAAHKAAVMAMTALADIEAFDYRAGYPPKLAF